MKRFLLTNLLTFVYLFLCAATQKEPTSYNYQRGIEAVQAGRITEGLDYLQREIHDNPKSGHTYAWLASACGSKHNNGQALNYVNKAIKLLPKNDKKFLGWVYGMRAMIDMDFNDLTSAIADYTMAIKLQPEEITYYNDRANLYFQHGFFEEASIDYQKMIDMEPGNVAGYMGLGRTHMNQNQLDEAIRVFEHVIQLNPDYSLAYSYRADCFMQQNHYEEAADDIIKAISIDDDTKAYFLLLKFTNEEQYALMKAKLKIKIAKNPSVAIWTNYLAALQQTVNDFAGAIETYQKAKQLDPSEWIDENIAQCYYLLGDYEQALHTINQVLEIDSLNPNYLLLKANILHFGLGRTNETVDICSQLIAINPEDFQAYYYRGWFGLYTPNIQEAVEDLTLSLAQNRRYASAYLARARGYKMLGKDSLAELDLQKTIEWDNSFYRLDAQYAKIYLGLNEEVKAHMDSLSITSNYYDVACIYSLLKDSIQSVKYLEKAFLEGELSLSHILIDDDLHYVRSTQLFATLMDKWTDIVANRIVRATEEQEREEQVVEVSFVRVHGVTKVDCTINDLPLSFVFDTGASDVTISQVEANFMHKNGYLEESDIIGKQQYRVASGGITEGTVVNLRSINFGGLTLTNVRASVVSNQNAPLLLGQSILRRLGKIEIDNERRMLIITHKK
ncbi:MAG: tetratricopeptide repeat protein [Prevotellaceae bacterium]|nr:tetratricopeptide repeat protein [Candidatus Faecinaster equi]